MDAMTPTVSTLPSPGCGGGEVVTIASGGSLAGAICAVSTKMEAVAKLGTNDFHKYTYARMPDLMRVLGPLMAQHGITVLQSEVGHELIADGVLRVEFDFTITHAPSGESRIVKSLAWRRSPATAAASTIAPSRLLPRQPANTC
jgi:ERF superfamily